MGKGNIFVLINIEKTVIKALMLNPCPHNVYSLTFTNSTISQNSHSQDHTLFLLHQECFQQHKGTFLILFPLIIDEDKLAYKGQRGNKWVEIIWEEDGSLSL